MRDTCTSVLGSRALAAKSPPLSQKKNPEE